MARGRGGRLQILRAAAFVDLREEPQQKAALDRSDDQRNCHEREKSPAAQRSLPVLWSRPLRLATQENRGSGVSRH
jgi:hypothetical protein